MSGCHCHEVRDLLQPFLDGELEVERSVTILKHLELCPPCRGRVDDERQLHALVPRACRTPVDPPTTRKLLDGCYARCAAEGAAAAAPRRWRRAGLTGAVLLAVGAAGALLAPHVGCWFRGECRTKRLLAVAHHRSELDAPLPIERADMHGVTPPEVKGLTLVGASPLLLAGVEVGPLLRYRTKCDGTDVVLFRLADAHFHAWETMKMCDGLDYVALEIDGTRLLAWECDEGGGLWCVMGQSERLSQDRLLALATPLRHPR